MYIPQTFANSDLTELHGFIESHAFGTLVVPSANDGPLEVSHLPFLLERHPDGGAVLVSHVARANPIWQLFDGRRTALVIFHGPHAYVSPSWYTSRNEVPTWNYVVVHAHGAPRLLDGAGLARALHALVETHEAGTNGPDQRWSIGELTPEKYRDLSQAIVGFEIPIARIEGKFKLSQNRKPDDRQGAIRGLEERGSPDDLALAGLMRLVKSPTG
jgi:transcriptional regulator